MREKHQLVDWLLCIHSQTGKEPAAPVCTPTSNWTGDPFGYRMRFQPLGHTSQGCLNYLVSYLEYSVFPWLLHPDVVLIWLDSFFLQELQWCIFSSLLSVVVICPITGDVSFSPSYCLPSFSSVLFPFVINLYSFLHQTFSWLTFLYLYGFTDSYFIQWAIIYTVIIYFDAQIVPNLTSGLYTLDMFLSFFEHFFSRTKCSKLTLYFPCLALESPISPTGPVPFIEGSHHSLWAELGNICIPCTYTYWHLYLLTLKSIFI